MLSGLEALERGMLAIPVVVLHACEPFLLEHCASGQGCITESCSVIFAGARGVPVRSLDTMFDRRTEMRIEASATVGRPVAVVWDFYAVHHVDNHPRWDPTIQLEATSNGPIGLGTVIKRRVTRFGRVTDGTMEVTEFAPEAAMRVRTQDGPITIDGWALFEAIGGGETRLTIGGDIPGIDEPTGEQIRTMMGRSVENIKELIESAA